MSLSLVSREVINVHHKVNMYLIFINIVNIEINIVVYKAILSKSAI